MRMIWPTGSTSGAEQLVAHHAAEHGDLRRRRDVLRREERARRSTGHERISGRSTSVPCTCVFQFWLPATTWPRVFDAGGDVLHAGQLRDRRRVVRRRACWRCPGPAARRPA